VYSALIKQPPLWMKLTTLIENWPTSFKNLFIWTYSQRNFRQIMKNAQFSKRMDGSKEWTLSHLKTREIQSDLNIKDSKHFHKIIYWLDSSWVCWEIWVNSWKAVLSIMTLNYDLYYFWLIKHILSDWFRQHFPTTIIF
jgi:hypothetical protein